MLCQRADKRVWRGDMPRDTIAFFILFDAFMRYLFDTERCPPLSLALASRCHAALDT